MCFLGMLISSDTGRNAKILIRRFNIFLECDFSSSFNSKHKCLGKGTLWDYKKYAFDALYNLWNSEKYPPPPPPPPPNPTPQNAWNCISGSLDFKIFRGSMPPNPRSMSPAFGVRLTYEKSWIRTCMGTFKWFNIYFWKWCIVYTYFQVHKRFYYCTFLILSLHILLLSLHNLVITAH